MEHQVIFFLAPSMVTVKDWARKNNVVLKGAHYLHSAVGLLGVHKPLVFKLPGWTEHPMWKNKDTQNTYLSRKPIEVDEKWVIDFLKRQEDQPLPTEGRQSVTDELIELLKQRQEKGIATYGRSLETFNGRDAKRDALEESLDLNQYLMQMYLEEKAIREQLVYEIHELRAFKNNVTNIVLDGRWAIPTKFKKIETQVTGVR